LKIYFYLKVLEREMKIKKRCARIWDCYIVMGPACVVYSEKDKAKVLAFFLATHRTEKRGLML
jgi:hypothetical protein